jgi:hypothetical protein
VAYFQAMKRELGLKSLEDWYTVHREDVEAKDGGCALLAIYYQNSLQKALMDVFPHHNWQEWRFHRHNVPNDAWLDAEKRIKFFHDLQREQKLWNMDDWYRVSPQDIVKHGGTHLLHVTIIECRTLCLPT